MTEPMVTLLKSVFGNECWDDSAEETAERIVGYWMEYAGDDPEFRFTTFKAYAQQMIIVKDIEFVSICAHHLLPFYGKAHVGYLPHDLMVGVSKIPRTVDHFARRPQTQERMAHQIADFLKQKLSAKGVAVVLEATHTCMACRGVRKPTALMIVNEMRGSFLTDPAPRQEFLASIGRLS
jgi:GTP cyclohydrolase I